MSDDSDDADSDVQYVPAQKRSEEPVRTVPTSQSRSTEAVTLTSIILNVYIKFDKKQCVVNLINELSQPNKHLPKDSNGSHFSTLHQYILTSTRDSIDMSNQSKRLTYQPNLLIKKNDAFGPWTFNPLLTLLSLEYQYDPAHYEQFPPVWKTDSNTKTQIKITKEYETKTSHSTTSELPKKTDDATLEGLLRLICQQNQRNESNVPAWLEAFRTESIDTVEHLQNAVADERIWDSIQSVKHLVKQMIKDYVQLNNPSMMTNQFNDIYQDSDATLIGDIHRIRRYFHHVTKTVQHIAYLDRQAVDLAIVEIRKTYDDDGNVLNNIHSYLRTFCHQSRTMTDEEHTKQQVEWREEKNRLMRETQTLRDEMKILEEEASRARGPVKVYSEELKNTEKEKQDAFTKAEQSASNAATVNRRNTVLPTWARQREQSKQDMVKAEQKVTNARIRLKEAQAKLAVKTELIWKKSNTIAENDEKIQDLDVYLKINVEESLRKLSVKYGRGLLLYGPPGTGKSELLKRAAIFAGITMTTTALSAGELNRPYVGETERLLVDIMYRARTIPYLIGAMTIDEIDGLVPKRTNNAQQSKVDGISVLLSHIEGVKDIPNLIVLGATNRRNMMDEAFLRRMQAKCFVGRPSPAIRKKMLGPLLYMDATVFSNQMMNFLVKITTNFSGAAVGALKSKILVAMDTYQSTDLNEKLFLDLAHDAARDFSCWFGTGTLPEICRLYPNIFSSKTNQQEKYSLKLPNSSPTGRILVDLQERKCLIELQTEATLDEDLDEEETSTDTLVSRFINGCSSRNIDTIQIIDLSFLIKNNASEESQIFEVLTTMFEECDEYNRSMLIFDIDSLIMLSVSDSAMSKSLSISNIHLYQFIREKCKKAVVGQKSADPNQSNVGKEFLKERWIVIIVKHPLLRSLLVEDIEFKKTFRQIQQEYDDEQKRLENETPKTCPKCEQSYLPSQLNYGCCRYHDGFIVDIDHPNDIISPEDARRIMQNARLAADNAPNDGSAKPEIPKLYWGCCLAAFGNDQPCKTGICGLPKELQEVTFEPNANLILIVRKHFREQNEEAKTKIADFLKHYQNTNKTTRRNIRPAGNSSAPPSRSTVTNGSNRK